MRFPLAALFAVAGCAVATGALAQAPGAAGPSAAGKPANLCQELVAFLKQPDPTKPAASGAAPAGDAKADPNLTTAVQAPKPGDAPKAAGDGAPTESGLSAPITTKTGQGAPGPQGAEQKTAAPASAPAPAPTANTAASSGKITLDQAEGLAAANDLPGCRNATQTLRRAGAPLPASLLALGALDLKYYQ
jgi:hypothetical protein